VHNGGDQAEKERMLILGSKGGSKSSGGGAPVEAPDTLKSDQFVKIVDLVSEGEIEGLVEGGLKSVYLNDIPVENSDGSFNFEDVFINWQDGTNTQGAMKGYNEIEQSLPGGGELLSGVQKEVVIPVSSGADYLKVTLAVPTLTSINDEGEIVGSTVTVRLEIKADAGAYVLVRDVVITGKTTAKYQRQEIVDLPAASTDWTLRVTRISADVTSLNNNPTTWETYTIVNDTKLKYPNSAVFGVQVGSEQFNSIPTRGYELKGMKVQIPDNYNPVTRVYTGTWLGIFDAQLQWTDNPVWCFYDMIVNDRYGLGQYISESQIDKFALYSIAQYCDELVDTGLPSPTQEPRFTCNLYLQTRDEAFNVLTLMSSIFRAIVYYGAGSLVTVQDAPTGVSYIFNESNIVDGEFNYSGSSLDSRFTVALVSEKQKY
jgi:predicted phage tail protein